MNIRFTNHAKKRCIQRNISEKWIEARLRTIPLSPSLSTHEKMFDGTNVFVVYRDGSTSRTVITLFLSIERRKESKVDVSGHLNNSTVQDMLSKAVGKSKKRGKRNKVKKWR